MGFMAETALIKTVEKGDKKEQELLTALLAAQQETNRLLSALLQIMSQPAAQRPGTVTWGTARG